MAKTKISEFNANPALNTDIDSINIAEGCAPSGINDAIRELMSQLKDWQAGTSNDPMVIGSSGSLTLNQGTANGVAYLNGSKVVTSGSALTFSGSALGVNATSTDASMSIQALTANYASVLSLVANNDNGAQYNNISSSTSGGTVHWRIGGVAGTSQLPFSVGGSEGMRLTSTGLGIGTSSPSAKLSLEGSGTYLLTLNNTAQDARIRLLNSGTEGGQISASSTQLNVVGSSSIGFRTNGSLAATLDSSGNLGLGVTPSAWGYFKAAQVGVGSLVAPTAAANTVVYNNAYYNGSSEIYITSNAASEYQQLDGAHIWKRASSGTAGNAITFTQAMTLDASGNLGVGTTSPVAKVSINGENTGLTVDVTTPRHGFMKYTNYGTGLVGRSTDTDGNISIWLGRFAGTIQSPTTVYQDLCVDNSGNVLVGTTTASAKLTTVTTGNAVAGFFKNDASGYQTITVQNAGASGTRYLEWFVAGTTDVGSISSNGTSTAYNTTSDYRLKNVIGAVTGHGARIDALEPIEYEWKSDGSRTRGFLAHKFQEVYADSVTGTKDAVDEQGNPVYQAMQASSSEVIADLVAEIQSLRKRLADAGL